MRWGRVLPFALGSVVSGAVAVVAGACDSSSDAEPTVTTDGASDAPIVDARADVRSDAGPTPRDGGHCAPVKGACDVVLQDCPDKDGKPQECVVTGADASYATACQPAQPSQALPRGRSCCPGAANPCLPGLTCVGDPCVDGGPVTGRCSPACCEGDDTACGQSDPEGISGACDITLFVEDDTEIHRVCSYRERCRPFGQGATCKPGQTCLVEDKLGSAGCINSFNKTLGEACKYGNDCADGLLCLTLVGEDGGVCRMQCLTPNAVHPFDAGVEDGGPYKGGCPSGSACNLGPFDDLPPWLSFCQVDGG